MAYLDNLELVDRVEMCPYRVPTPPGKSWIFFLENSRTWKVLEKHFGPGKSWKLKLKVTEKYSLEKYP